MTTKFEMAMVVLLVVSILLSGVAVYYVTGLTGLTGMRDDISELAAAEEDLASAMTDLAVTVGAGTEAIKALEERIAVIEERTAPGVKHVIFHFDWIPTGAHMDYYVAKEKFWPELGLDVTIVRGTGSGDTAKKVAMGIADFGRATFDAGAQLRAAESMPIKAIWTPYQKNDAGLFYIKGRDAGRGPIDLKADPKTLEGKIFGEPAWSVITMQLPAFCAAVGVDYDKVTVINLDPGATMTSTLAGDIDCHGCSAGDGELYKAVAAQEGLPGEYILFGDFGLEMIGDTVWTSDRLIAEDPETVAKFVEGLQKGYKWTAENLDEAAKIFVKYVTGYTGREDVAKDEWISKGEFGVDKAAMKANGIGWMNPTTVEKTVNNVYIVYGISEERHLDSYTECFTNEFIKSDICPETWPF